MNNLLTGSLAFDRIMNFPGHFKEHILPDKIHNLNVSFNIERLEEKKGGTVGNIAYSLSLLQQQPIIIASAGNDFTAYLQYLKDLGISTEHIEVHEDVTTASAYIITDMSDNQITGFFMGAMERETSATMTDWNAADSMVCLSPGNKQDMLRYSRECKENSTRYIFDPGQTLPFLEPEEITELITGAYILVTNDYELQMILNRTELTEQDIREKVSVLITTLGKEGSTIMVEGEQHDIPVCSTTDVKDPTGAGDAYRSGIIAGISNDLSWDQVGKVASVAAVYAVEQYGTQEHSYTMKEFQKRYQESFNEQCPI